MIRVSNKACVRHLGRQSMKAAKTRNCIAVLAIALTTVLFTSLFTIALSINDGFQQSNFRQCGGWNHGSFKYLTEEQFDQIKTDSLIQEWGLRRFVGMPDEIPFNKSHVEVGYSDATQAHWMYCDPIEGALPQEGTDQAATDTRVLELLGVEPELGAQFTVTFPVDGHMTTQTFTLCGWWEYDEAVVANHILIPLSRAQQIYDEVGLIPGQAKDGMTGSWNLDVMFKNSLNIDQNMKQVLANFGYQDESPADGDNYIRTGVNWGYSASQLAENIDPGTILAIATMLLLIVFTGYLIIYNVFQISVANDIRFYGLLKTIGTTPSQISRMIRLQALLLSLLGIPLGLVGGWFVGGALTPVIISRLDGIVSLVSLNPAIFIVSSLFSLFTVLLSCYRPGKIAAKVSPVEAVRYTEGSNIKRKKKRSVKNLSLFSMAKSNLGRNRTKTVVTVLSLSLAVVLLNLTVTFTNGFDMDKYLANFVTSDFVLADAKYFHTGALFGSDTLLPESVIDEVEAQGGITEGGRVYGRTFPAQEFITEDYYRTLHGMWMNQEEMDRAIKLEEKNQDGLIADTAQLYGMEPFALDRLRLLEGDLSPLYTDGSRSIAAVYSDDDYGEPRPDSHWAKLGDTVTIRYVEEWEYYNPLTGEVFPEGTNLDTVAGYASRAKRWRDVDYTVCALVCVPSSLSYRFYGSDEFILNDQTFCTDSGTDAVMLYAFNTTDEANAAMESFLADYTENQNPQFDYESKATYVAQFESFRSMFLMLGGTLSFIIGLVGILNFFNAILTGILTRKREFAMLQSVGMTGRQLKQMLVYEGLCYSLGAALLSLAIALLMGPLVGSAVENLFWFFTYRFTILPIFLLLPVFVLLGSLVPLGIYHSVAKLTIVERLRETE
mgnify:CR=1 FL=1